MKSLDWVCWMEYPRLDVVPTVCIMMSRLLHWGTACTNEWKLYRTKFNIGHFDISLKRLDI
jgi:hypothetical protein